MAGDCRARGDACVDVRSSKTWASAATTLVVNSERVTVQGAAWASRSEGSV